MKPIRTTFLSLWLVLALLLAAAPQPGQALPQPRQAPLTDAVLDICTDWEPNTFYIYSEIFDTHAAALLPLIYDGPFDHAAFGAQPVILTNTPGYSTMDLRLYPATVAPGMTVFDAARYAMVTIQPTSTVGLRQGDGSLVMHDFAITPTAQTVRQIITYTLRTGVAWSDGQPLTSFDSLYSFNLAANPATPAPARKAMVERTAAYTAPQSNLAVWKGYPGYIEYDHTNAFFTPLPQHAWAGLSASQLLTATTSNRTPPGWGPFKIDQWIAGDRIELSVNPHYFRAGQGLPRYQQAVVHFVGNPLQGLIDGTCDITPPDASLDLFALRDADLRGQAQRFLAPSLTYEHIDFNMLPNPAYTGFAAQVQALQDANVRKAVAACVDRQAIIDQVWAGAAFPARTYIPSTHPYAPPNAMDYPYDPPTGQALLAAAGWEDSNGNGIRDKNGVEFSLNYTTRDNPFRRQLLPLVSAQLLANCGIQATPVYLSGIAFQEWPDGPIFGRNYDFAEFGWIIDVRPSCDLYSSQSIAGNANPGGQNNTGYSSPAFDTACNTALDTLDEAVRLFQHREAARLFSEDLPSLVLYHRANVAAAAPHITGYGVDSTDATLYAIEQVGSGVAAQAAPGVGATLTSPGDQTAYQFPAGVFTQTVTITHTAVSPLAAPATGVWQTIGHFFTIRASSGGAPVQPSGSYTMTVQYNEAELFGADEATLALYTWNGAAWVVEPTSSVDTAANIITAHPTHFSTWAALAEPQRLFLPILRRSAE